MPIRREFQPFYKSLEWKAIRARILARAGGRCERCGKPDRRYVFVARDGSGLWWKRGEWPRDMKSELHLIKVVLTVAHLNHDHRDNRDENLAALCQRCHLVNDTRFHQANSRRTRATKSGQQWLDEHFEQAARPGEEWRRIA